jgi:hypothetical protein
VLLAFTLRLFSTIVIKLYFFHISKDQLFLKSPPPKWWAFFKPAYLQTHPGTGQSAVFGQSFLGQFAGQVVL